MPIALVKKFFESYQFYFLKIWHELFSQNKIDNKNDYMDYLSQKLHHRIILSAPIVTILILLKIVIYFLSLNQKEWLGVLSVNLIFTDTALLSILIISVFNKKPNEAYYNNMFILASLALFSCVLVYTYAITHHIYYPYEIIGLSILLFLWVFNYPVKWVITVPLLTLVIYYFMAFTLNNKIHHEKIIEFILLAVAFLIGLFYSLMNGANEHHLYQSLKYAESQALTDSLTKIYNRKGFLKNFDKLKKIAQREKKDLYIAILDIDNFKKVNDNYGHDIGDNVISMVASQISDIYRRPLDLIARWGGEEFIVSWCEENPDLVSVMGQKICQRVADAIIFSQSKQISVTVSVGITRFAEHDISFTETLKRADTALYKAKNNGKNQFIINYAIT